METFNDAWIQMSNAKSQSSSPQLKKVKAPYYNDDSFCNLKRYRFTPLSKVPAEVLLSYRGCNKPHTVHLRVYIEANLEKIIQRSDYEKRMLSTMLVCTKLTFGSKASAKAALSIIRETSQNHHKPNRAYECPFCKDWHLTSQPHPKWG